MSRDFQGPESKPDPSSPIGDPWQLPQIVSVTAHKVKSKEPWVRVHKGQELEYDEAVQLTVTTSESFPITSDSPVLVVGDVRVDYWIGMGENRYAFLVFEADKLEEGAPIHLAWYSHRPTEKPKESEAQLLFRLDN